MRPVNVVDGATVFTEDAFSLRRQLVKSVELYADGRIPNETPVIWEGERTTWGTLSQNERMNCSTNADGVLEGEDPF